MIKIHDFQLKTKKRTIIEVFDKSGFIVDKVNVAFEDKDSYLEQFKIKFKDLV